MDSQEIDYRINDLSLKISEQCCSNSMLRDLLHAILDVNIDFLNKIDELERRLDERTN